MSRDYWQNAYILRKNTLFFEKGFSEMEIAGKSKDSELFANIFFCGIMATGKNFYV
jgi:hypothetical protein